MFNSFTIENLSGEEASELSQLRAGYITRIYRNNLDHAFRYHYKVTSEQADYLARLFVPRIAHQDDDPSARLLDSTHPVAAVLNEFSDHHAKLLLRSQKDLGNATLSIGDSVRPKVEADHNCMLIDNTVDAARVAASMAGRGGGLAAYARDKSRVQECHSGAQHCNFQAPVAVAMHSTYDIGPETLVDIFERHGLQKLVVYMFIPSCLYDTDLHAIDADIFHTYASGHSRIFSLHDFSRAYYHDEKTWQFWAKFARIRCGSFQLVREDVDAVGPLHIISIVRTADFPGHMPRTVPLGYVTREYYKIPSFAAALSSRFTARQKELSHHIVPKHVVDNALMYAGRVQDEAYRYNELATMIAGWICRIRIGSKVYHVPWKAHPKVLHDVVMMLFVMGAAMRKDRTQAISAAFRHMRSYDGGGFMYELRTHFLRLFTNAAAFEKFDLETHELWSYAPVELEDYVFVSEYTVLALPRAEMAATPLCDVPEAPVPLTSMAEEPDTVSTAFSAPSSEASTDTNATPLSAGETSSIAKSVESDRIVLLDAPVLATLNSGAAIDARTKAYQIPRTFKAGHCAMRAFWSALPANARPRQSVLIAATFSALLRHPEVTKADAERYIFEGLWETTFVSAIALEVLASNHDVCVTVHVEGGPDQVVNQKGRTAITLYWASNHYSHLPAGGARDKYTEIADIIVEHAEALECAAPLVIYDISAAPGSLARCLVSATGGDCDIYAYNYTGKGGVPWDKRNDSANINKTTYSNYTQLAKALARTKDVAVDYLICDAATEVNSEAITTEMAQIVMNHRSRVTACVFKAFGNPRELFKLIALYDHVRVEAGVASERWFYFGTGPPPTDGFVASGTYDELWDRYSLPITDHTMILAGADIARFAKSFFVKPFDTCPQPEIPGGATRVTFKALTGYASAAKTTRAYEAYPGYVFVSPTRCLNERHAAAMVRAYTQHKIFEQRDVEGIVVDEAQTFPVEYLALLTLAFPLTPIVILGDVYQTSRTEKFTHIRDAGVANNLRDVFKVPRDIASLLNRKFGFDMRSRSDVEHGLRRAKLEDVKALPILAWNVSSVAWLKDHGYSNAQTIATYTGSRSDDVCFFVDSKAIAAGLSNRREEIYTVMTRARTQLVFVGNAEDAMRKYFTIDGTMIRQYELVSELVLATDIIPPAEPTLAFTTPRQLAESCNVSVDMAQSTLEEEVVYENDAAAYHGLIQPPDYDTDLDGGISLTTAMAAPPPSEARAARVSENALGKTQVSNNVKSTLQTAMRRYLKRMPAVSAKEGKVMLSDLQAGFSMAVTGKTTRFGHVLSRLAATQEELSIHYAAYIEALQEKMDQNPSVADDLDKEYDQFNMAMEFFNKRQTKHYTGIGSDTKDKVGQGVAAMPKNVNLLLSAYFRCMLSKLRAILREDGRNILLAVEGSDEDLNDEYLAMLGKCDETGKSWACNDFSEWDSSWKKQMTDLMATLLVAVGAPGALVHWYVESRKRWFMIIRGKVGRLPVKATAEINYRQLTGGPGTICENSVGDMSLCFTLFKYDNFEMAMFKGDDSAVLCSRCTLRAGREGHLQYFNPGTKLAMYNAGEFAGFFLTKLGMFPDVVRYACKFIGKDYTSAQHFHEAVASVKARVAMVRTEEQLNAGAYAATEHYARLSVAQVRNLFDFLRRAHLLDYSQLRVEFRPTLTPVVEANLNGAST